MGNQDLNHQPTLYLMLGYPGAGKTTAAKILAELTGAEHIWADYERRQTHGKPSYSQAENDGLYQKLNQQTADLLEQKHSVVYDTAFNHQKDRVTLRTLAHNLGIQTVIIWVKAPKEIAKTRAQNISDLHGTRVLGADMSDERFEELVAKLEHPDENEIVVELDGQKLSKDYIKQVVLER